MPKWTERKASVFDLEFQLNLDVAVVRVCFLEQKNTWSVEIIGTLLYSVLYVSSANEAKCAAIKWAREKLKKALDALDDA